MSHSDRAAADAYFADPHRHQIGVLPCGICNHAVVRLWSTVAGRMIMYSEPASALTPEERSNQRRAMKDQGLNAVARIMGVDPSRLRIRLRDELDSPTLTVLCPEHGPRSIDLNILFRADR